MDYKTSTWKDVEEFIKRKKEKASIIIPIGCLEEHGPHLPISTDTMLAVDFASAISKEDGLDLIVGPEIDFGVSVLTQGFPGTVKIRFETLKALVADLASSCARWGCKKIILWTWHGGSSHQICLREASLEIISKHPDVAIYILRGVKLFDDEGFKAKIDAILESKSEHAGELETSLMMHLHPGLVKADFLFKEYPEYPKLRVISEGFPYMKYGIIGDATLASAAKGKKIYELILEELSRNVKNLIEDS